MGKTTNNLLAAADLALMTGKVDLSAVRDLHEASAGELGLEQDPSFAEVLELLVRHAQSPNRQRACGLRAPVTRPPRPTGRMRAHSRRRRHAGGALHQVRQNRAGIAPSQCVLCRPEAAHDIEACLADGSLPTRHRTRDRVVSFGERMSGRMVAAQLRSIGVPAQQFESWDLGVVTSSRFGDASVLDSSWPKIKQSLGTSPRLHCAASARATLRLNRLSPSQSPPHCPGPGELDASTVAVITGFIGKDEQGAITTLGRGGSDLTASLIGAAAGYDEVQVWKE